MDEDVKKALLNISLMTAESLLKNLKYDYHFDGYVTSVNQNKTYDVYAFEKDGYIYGIKASVPSVLSVGDKVQIRETKNVPDSYLIDYVEK